MITKTAMEILDPAGASLERIKLLGGIGALGAFGAGKARGLTDGDRDVLAAKYDLDSDANFMMRNAGRAIVGGAIGAIPGKLVHFFSGTPTGKSLGALASIGGAVWNANDWADKYTKDNAEKIRKKYNQILQ